MLQIIPALYFGGAEKVVVNLATRVDRTRFEPMVCCTRALGPLGEPIQSAGVPLVLSAPADGRHRPYQAIWRLERVLARLRPDVVHTHGMTALFQTAPLALLRRLPYWVHTFHFGNYPNMNHRYMTGERVMSRLPHRLIAVSHVQRDAILEHLRVPPSRIITLHNGVPDQAPAVDRSAIPAKRAALGFAPDTIVVGTIAVLGEQKGIPHLLDAAATLVQRDSRLRFLIVGGGPLEASLREKAVALGLSGRVVFTGWRPDVPELLQVLDVFVMPSLWEAMPLALLEAMAARRPIVATNVGENGRILQEGVSGLLIAPGSSEEISAAIRRLVEDAGLADTLASGARRRFEDAFTVSHMVARHCELYRSVVASGR